MQTLWLWETARAQNQNSCINALTPSSQNVPPEIFPLRDEGESKQRLQVHALHQQPEVISQDAELEESYSRFTRHLKKSEKKATEMH